MSSTAGKYTGVSHVVSVGIVISPLSKQMRNRGWIPGRGKSIFRRVGINYERWLLASWGQFISLSICPSNRTEQLSSEWIKLLNFRRLRPPLWSSGQSFWLQIQRSRVRFPALPDFLSSCWSGTGSTQPREINWGATWIKKVAAPGLDNRD